MKRPSSWLSCYAIAASAVGTVLVVKLLLDSVFAQDVTPFRLFLAAAVVATFYGGLGSGLFATALVVPVVGYFFLGPVGVTSGMASEAVPLGLFVLEGILVSALVAALRRARERAEESAREARGHREGLRESEERFRLMVEGAKDYAIYMLDPEGKVASWNEGARRIKGYEAEEIIGRHFSLFFAPEDVRRGKPEKELRIAAEEGRFEEEGWRVCKDGSMFWADVVLTALRDDETGRLRGFSKITRDATERKRAEEAMRQSEERYRAVVEQAGEGIFLFDPETKRILEANPALRKMFGYDAEEVQGITLYDLVPHDPEGVDRNAMRTLKRGHLLVGERRYRRKDGTLVDVEVSGNAISYDGGEEVICSVVRDITERKRAEKELRRSEARFRALVQNASDVITVLEADGTVRYESPAIQRVLGYRPDELVGENAFDYVHPDDREKAMDALAEAVKSGESTPVEVRFSRKDGSWCHFEAIGSNLLEDPSVRGIVVNSRDVTERKRAEEKLRGAFDSLLALYEAGQILGSTLSSEEVVRSLLRIMRGVSGLAAAVISAADEDGELRVWHADNLEALRPGVRHAPEAVRARVLALENGERRLFRLPGTDPQPGDLTGLCLPLKIRERVAGVLEAYGPERLAQNDAIELLSSLAAQAAGALENARLYEELADREHRLHELVGKVLTAQEEERRRVAYEVHDGLAQTAAAALQLLHTFARRHPPASEKARTDLTRALGLVQATVSEARQVIADLRPTVLDDLGLSAAIRAQIDKLGGDRQIDYEADIGEERLPESVEVALFRVTQEALNNAAKHAPSAPVRIELRRVDGRVRLRVRDRGPGFDPEKTPNGGGPGERVGLSSMRERVALLGGRLEVSSRPGEGTEVAAEVPLPEGRQEREGEGD